jgi:outer membrane protein
MHVAPQRARASTTRSRARAAAVLAASVLSTVARDAGADVKLELGARAGYALPFGAIAGDGVREAKLDDVAAGQVPLWFDIGARMGPAAFAGVYVQYGVAVLADDFLSFCDELDRSYRDEGGSASCQVHDLRLGAEFHYHFAPFGELDPWAGVGFGYEWLSAGVFVHGADGNGDHAATFHGFEFANLQAGLDVRVTSTMSVGPFAAFTLGSYERIARSCAGGLCDEDDDGLERIRASVLHEWLFFGIRAEFLP